MSEQDGGGWGLVLSFAGVEFGNDTEHAFVHGFEAGQIWQRMTCGHEAEIETTAHRANRELLTRAAAAEGWAVEIKPTDYAEWIDVRLTKTGSAKPNPRGLRVVRWGD